MLNTINHLFDYFLPALSLIAISKILYYKFKFHYVFMPYLFFVSYLFISVIPFNFIKSDILETNLKVVKYETLNATFTLFEFVTFYIFINRNIQWKASKRVMKGLLFLFITLFIIISIYLTDQTNNFLSFTKASYFITQVEYLIILFYCLFYFKDYLNQDWTKLPCKKSPLLIISSIFIYTSISLPFIILSTDIDAASNAYKILTLLHYSSLSSIILLIFLSSNKIQNQK